MGTTINYLCIVHICLPMICQGKHTMELRSIYIAPHATNAFPHRYHQHITITITSAYHNIIISLSSSSSSSSYHHHHIIITSSSYHHHHIIITSSSHMHVPGRFQADISICFWAATQTKKLWAENPFSRKQGAGGCVHTRMHACTHALIHNISICTDASTSIRSLPQHV